MGAADAMDVSKFFFQGKYKRDFIYRGFNVTFFIHFLTKIKRKADGKLKSYVDLRKYYDAMKWGATTAGEELPSKFYSTVDSFLAGYQKEHTRATKEGNVDVTSSDPIPF